METNISRHGSNPTIVKHLSQLQTNAGIAVGEHGAAKRVADESMCRHWKNEHAGSTERAALARRVMQAGPSRRAMLALMGWVLPAAALAGYPDRPVKLVVALAPGGPADTAARVFAPYLAEGLGQSVVIENRSGASSVIGTEAVVRAAPDGYTLLFGSSSS